MHILFDMNRGFTNTLAPTYQAIIAMADISITGKSGDTLLHSVVIES